MARELTAAIEIHAPPARVWEALTDFPLYRFWNPFILAANGPLRVGEKIKMRIRLHDGIRINIRPTILKVEPEIELCWLGRLLIPGLVDGEHHLVIVPMDSGSVQFLQREVYRGLLVPVLWRRLQKDARSGFEAMNRALKRLLE